MKRQLDDWLTAYMDYSENTEPDPLYRQWCAISTIAAVLERKCFVRNGTEERYFPNFFIVLVGKATARKTTAIRTARRLLDALEVPPKIAPQSTTREGFLKILADAITIYTNSAGESFTQTAVTVHASELSIFLRPNEVLMYRDLNDLYDGQDKWEYKPKLSTESVLYNVCVNILGGITPQLIQTSLPPEAIGGGFTARTVFVYAPDLYKRVIIPQLDQRIRAALVADLADISALCGEFTYTEQFFADYAEWYVTYDQHLPFDDARFEGYFGRRQELVWKLSMISAVSRSNRLELTRVDFDRALQWLEDVERPMQLALGGVGSSPIAWLVNGIERMLVELPYVDTAVIMARYRHDATLEEVEQALSILEMSGKCTVAKTTGRVSYNEKAE